MEMLWDCPICHHENKGVQGEDEGLRCSGCGAQKTADTPYRMPRDISRAAAVTDPRHVGWGKAAAHWTCSYCGSQERDLQGQCSSCGASKDERVRPPQAQPLKLPIEVPKRRSTVPLLVGGLATIGVVSGALYWGLSSHAGEATITKVKWSREVRLEEKKTLESQDWADNVPFSAFNKSCNSKVRGTTKCNPHRCNPHPESYEYNCTGGGTRACNCRPQCTDTGTGLAKCKEVCDRCPVPKTCQTGTRTVYDTCYDTCPVTDMWCSYQYHSWETVQVENMQGSDNHPTWPELYAGPNQRVAQSARYEVHYTSGDQNWVETPTEQVFVTREVGQAHRIEWNHAGAFQVLD